MTFCVPCKKTIPSASTKINRVQEKVIYNELIKFELNRKHCLDTSIFLIIWFHRLQGIRIMFCAPVKKLLILNTPKSIQLVERWPIMYIPKLSSIECTIWILEHFIEFDSIGRILCYTPVKKTLRPIFTKINRVLPTATCNTHTKFEFNRMYRLDAIWFTHIHT